MTISKVRLTDFRNFRSVVFEFSPAITVIVGPNATGKTNILESLFLLSTGKSFKAKIEEEVINYKKNLARMKGLIGDTKLEILLTRGYIEVGDSGKIDKVTRKKLLVNGVSRRLIDFAGKFRVVLFGPQDLDLVTESPSLRRKFLDTVLSQVDREYRRATLSYEKGLRQRNKLLVRIREEGLPRSQLLFWDRLLIKNGDYVSGKREELIDFINNTSPINHESFDMEYDRSAISEGRLEQYQEEEIAAATTLVGPHRDDFILRTSKGRDLSRYGSRGEQRMGVLWLKLAELAFIKEKTQEEPTLLLDDILSELDHKHRDIVLKVAHGQQTIITTADPHFVEGLKGVSTISTG